MNKRVLQKATKELNKTKAPAVKKDIIVDPMGQWKYPGQVTRIPSDTITMEGVDYPVLGVPDNGQPVMMQPGAYYDFPGANYVDEYPQMKKGGGLKTKKYTRSIEGTNYLFAESDLFKKPKKLSKKRIFHPNAKYYKTGGESGCPEGYAFNPVTGECIEWDPEVWESEEQPTAYDPVGDVIYMNPNDRPEGMSDEEYQQMYQDQIEHEQLHRLQWVNGDLKGRTGTPLRMPSTVDNQEYDGDHYYNRRSEDESDLGNYWMEQHPNEANFIPGAVLYDKVINPAMYEVPWTAEGEARGYEGALHNGMESLFPKRKKGGALLTKKVTCKKCGWKWDAADGGNDVTTCHKCGGQGLVHAQDGGEIEYNGFKYKKVNGQWINSKSGAPVTDQLLIQKLTYEGKPVGSPVVQSAPKPKPISTVTKQQQLETIKNSPVIADQRKANQLRDEIRNENVYFPKGEPSEDEPEGIEGVINSALDYPMAKAALSAEFASNEGQVDNFRHANAGRYAAEAIKDMTGNIPYLSDAAAIIGANALGLGHEVGTYFTNSDDTKPWTSKLKESGEDMYNNFVGTTVGISDMPSVEKTDKLLNLSYSNQLPDGYVKDPRAPRNVPNNMYFKQGPKDPGRYRSRYEDGGEYVELDLTPKEIDKYRKGGFIVEDISVPSLNQIEEGGEPCPEGHYWNGKECLPYGESSYLNVPYGSFKNPKTLPSKRNTTQDYKLYWDPQGYAKEMNETAGNIQEGVDWYKDWYSKRKELPQFTEVAQKRLDLINDPATTSLHVKIRPSILLKNDEGANYFQPAKSGLNPAYNNKVVMLPMDREGERLYLGDTAVADNTLIHELSHFFDDFARQPRTSGAIGRTMEGTINKFIDPSGKPLPKDLIFNEIIPYEYRTKKPTDVPQSAWGHDIGNTSEMRAALNEWRMQNKIDPTKDYSIEEIQDIIKNGWSENYLLKILRNNPAVLKKMHDSYVSNDSNKELKTAAEGGASGCPPGYTKVNGQCKKVKPFVTSNPDEYAYRKAAYDDSLYLVKEYNSKQPKAEKYWKYSGLGPSSKERAVRTVNGFKPAGTDSNYSSSYSGWSPAWEKYMKNTQNYDKPFENRPIGYAFQRTYFDRHVLETPFGTKAFTLPGENQIESIRTAPRFKPPVQPVIFAKPQEKKEFYYPKKETKTDNTKKPVPPGQTWQGDYTESSTLDPKTGKVVTIKEPIYEDRLPIREPERGSLQPFIKKIYPPGPPEYHGVEPNIEESEVPMYATPDPGAEFVPQTERYIDWDGNSIGFNGIRFRKPGHGGDLIKKGRRHYLHYPSIETRNYGDIVPEEEEFEVGGIAKYPNGGDPKPRKVRREVKPFVTSDPKEYALRKAAYDDSLNLFNLTNAQQKIASVNKDFKLMTPQQKKDYYYRNHYNHWQTGTTGINPRFFGQDEGSSKIVKVKDNITKNNLKAADTDYYHPTIKPYGHYVNPFSITENFLYKKPVQQVVFQEEIKEDPILKPIIPTEQPQPPIQDNYPSPPAGEFPPGPPPPPPFNGVEPFIQGDPIPEYATPDRDAQWVPQKERYIDWNGNNISYKLPRFRKPGHSGPLVKGSRTHYLRYPSIETRNSADIIPEEEEFAEGGIAKYPDGGQPRPVQGMAKPLAPLAIRQQQVKPLKNSPIVADQKKYKAVQDEVKAKATIQKASQQLDELQKDALPQYEQPLTPQDWIWTLPMAGGSAMKSAGTAIADGMGALGTKAMPYITGALETSIPGMASIPGATVGNAIASGFATDAIVNRLPEGVTQLNNGQYIDATGNILTGLLDVAGAGMMSPIYQGAKSTASELARFLGTEEGLLSNTYKINPLAGKLNDYNRVVGQDAILDLQNSGLVRAGERGGVETGMGLRTSPYPSFGKGAPRQAYIDQTIQQGKTPFIISTNRPMGVSTLGRHGKGSTMFPIDETGNYMSKFSADEAKIFGAKPNWLKGYKEVPNVNTTKNSIQGFAKNINGDTFNAIPAKSAFSQVVSNLSSAITEIPKSIKYQVNNYSNIKKAPTLVKDEIGKMLTPEGIDRLKNLGVDDINDFMSYMDKNKLFTKRNLKSHAGTGVSNNQQFPYMNLDFDQLDKAFNLSKIKDKDDAVRAVISHELGHNIQGYLEHIGKSTDGLSSLDKEAVLKLKPFMDKNADPDVLNYFLQGSKGSEPLAHLRELKQNMLYKGVIGDINQKITPEDLGNFYINKSGYRDRVMSIVKPGDDAYKRLASLLNKTPVTVPAALGAGALLNQEEDGGMILNLSDEEIEEYKRGGWIVEYI